MSEPRKLVLHVNVHSIEGCGDALVFKVNAWRENKAGKHESYALELKACRYSARILLRELRKMHVRDRERIASEQARIDREIRELTQEQGI